MPGPLKVYKVRGKRVLKYHRGHGKMQTYSLAIDKKRRAKHVPPSPNYGQTGDYKH